MKKTKEKNLNRSKVGFKSIIFFILMLALTVLSACDWVSENLNATAERELENQSPAGFEQFLEKNDFVEWEDGYIFEGDVAFSAAKVEEIYNAFSNSGRGNIAIDRITLQRLVWSHAEAQDITYQFTTDMSTRYLSDEQVRNAFRKAASVWSNIANLNLREVTGNPVFTVYNVNLSAASWSAMSFFPHGDYIYELKFNLKYDYLYNTYNSLVGLFTHEIGHGLGFAHEHQRADSPDSNGQSIFGEPFGVYDAKSIMNYNARPYTVPSSGDIALAQHLYPYGRYPYAGAIPVPGVLEAENYDAGGEGVAFHDTDEINSGEAYRSEGVDIQISSLGGFNLGWMEAGEWLEYTLDVKETATYDLELMTASETGGGCFSIRIGESVQTGDIVIPGTGGWQTWRPVYVNGINLVKGTHVMRITIEAPGVNLDSIKFSTAGLQTPYSVQTIPGVIEAENFDRGGMNVAYFDTDPVNNGNAVYRNENVDIEYCSAGGYNLGYIAEGEWTEYTVSSVAAGHYNIFFDFASDDNISYKTVTVKLGGSTLGTVTFYSTGGWQKWQSAGLYGIDISGGMNQVLRLEYGGDSYNIDKFRFEQANTNLFMNGDFSNNFSSWTHFVHEQARGEIALENGYAKVTIYNGSYESWYIQLFQSGLLLETGKTYELVFDARAWGGVFPGNMDVHVEKNGGDYAPYMTKQTVSFGAEWTTFRFTFTMNAASDQAARVSFNMGKFVSPVSAAVIHIDNVKLIKK